VGEVVDALKKKRGNSAFGRAKEGAGHINKTNKKGDPSIEKLVGGRGKGKNTDRKQKQGKKRKLMKRKREKELN